MQYHVGGFELNFKEVRLLPMRRKRVFILLSVHVHRKKCFEVHLNGISSSNFSEF